MDPNAFESAYQRNKTLNKYEQSSSDDEQSTYVRRMRDKHKKLNVLNFDHFLFGDEGENIVKDNADDPASSRGGKFKNMSEHAFSTPQHQSKEDTVDSAPHSWPKNRPYMGIFIIKIYRTSL